MLLNWRHKIGFAAISVAASLALGAGTPALAQSKNVTIVVADEPDNMDPCTQSSSFTGRIIHQNVVEGMTELRPDGSIEPRLAKSWKRISPKTWRFTLNQGVTFHDGAKFNADAVVRALERVLKADFNCPIRNKYFSNFDVEATKISDYEVDITTSIPWPILPLYAGSLPIPSPNTPMDSLQLTAVGTGPFMFVHWKQQQEVLVKKNPNYWDKSKKVEVEEARYIFRKESSVRAAMVSVGEADLAPTISAGDANDPKTDVTYPNAETSWLRIDLTMAPLDDVRVRKALNLALDRQAMLGAFFPKGAQLAAQAWGPGVLGHNFEIDKRIWAYDPAKAKQLLAEAKADGVNVGGEIELQGRIGVYPQATEIMEAIHKYYKDIGLNVKLKMYELGQWRELHNKPFPEVRPAGVLQVQHDNATGDAVFSALYKHTCDGNTAVLCDAGVDKAIADAGQLEGEGRAKAFQEIARAIYEEHVDNVWLAHMVAFGRVSSKINYTPNVLTNSYIRLEDITFN